MMIYQRENRTLPEQPSSPLFGVRIARFLAFCVVFCVPLFFIFVSFSSSRCIISPSSNYAF